MFLWYSLNFPSSYCLKCGSDSHISSTDILASVLASVSFMSREKRSEYALLTLLILVYHGSTIFFFWLSVIPWNGPVLSFRCVSKRFIFSLKRLSLYLLSAYLLRSSLKLTFSKFFAVYGPMKR